MRGRWALLAVHNASVSIAWSVVSIPTSRSATQNPLWLSDVILYIGYFLKFQCSVILCSVYYNATACYLLINVGGDRRRSQLAPGEIIHRCRFFALVYK